MGKAITQARCPHCGGLLSSKRAAACRECTRRGAREPRPEWDAAQAARVDVLRAAVQAELAARRAAGQKV